MTNLEIEQEYERYLGLPSILKKKYTFENSLDRVPIKSYIKDYWFDKFTNVGNELAKLYCEYSVIIYRPMAMTELTRNINGLIKRRDIILDIIQSTKEVYYEC